MVNHFEYAKLDGEVTFFCFKWEIPFLSRFGPKKIKLSIQAEIGYSFYSNMRNSMVMLTFSVLDCKHIFWANLVQKFKFVCLR